MTISHLPKSKDRIDTYFHYRGFIFRSFPEIAEYLATHGTAAEKKWAVSSTHKSVLPTSVIKECRHRKKRPEAEAPEVPEVGVSEAVEVPEVGVSEAAEVPEAAESEAAEVPESEATEAAVSEATEVTVSEAAVSEATDVTVSEAAEAPESEAAEAPESEAAEAVRNTTRFGNFDWLSNRAACERIDTQVPMVFIRDVDCMYTGLPLATLQMLLRSHIVSGCLLHSSELDESSAALGTHIFYDFDCRKQASSVHLNSERVVAMQVEIMKYLAGAADDLSIYATHPVAYRLGPHTVVCGPEACTGNGSPHRATGSVYGSLTEERTDKWSTHGLVRPNAPVRSACTVKLAVIVALARMLRMNAIEYTTSSQTRADLERLQLVLVAICSVDLNPYTAAVPHLRLPATQKKNVPGSQLRPLLFLRSGECTDQASGGVEWLQQVAEVCTISYTGDTNSVCIPIGDPSTLSDVYLDLCRAELVAAINAFREPACVRAMECLRSEFGAKYDAFCRETAAHRIHLTHIVTARADVACWESITHFATNREPDGQRIDNQVPVVFPLDGCAAEIHSETMRALCTETADLRFYTKYPQRNWDTNSVQNELGFEASAAMRRRIGTWTKATKLKHGRFSVRFDRAFFALRTDSSFSYRLDFDVDTSACVWRDHKNATVVGSFRIHQNYSGEDVVTLRLGCWNRAGCNPPVFVVLGEAAQRRIMGIYQTYRTVSSVPRPLRNPENDSTCSLYRVPGAEEELDWHLATLGVAALCRELAFRRQFLQTISRCVLVTKVVPVKNCPGQWIARYVSHDVSVEYPVRSPQSPTWSDEQTDYFCQWIGDSEEFGLSIDNPGILFLGGEEIVAYAYLADPGLLSKMCAARAAERGRAIPGICTVPLMELTTPMSLFRLHMMIHMCRPSSGGAHRLLFVHNNSFSAMDTRLGGSVRPVADVDRRIWSHLLAKVYGCTLGSHTGIKFDDPARVALVTRPNQRSLTVDYGRVGNYYSPGTGKMRVDYGSRRVTVGERATDSNLTRAAFAFADVMALESVFRALFVPSELSGPWAPQYSVSSCLGGPAPSVSSDPAPSVSGDPAPSVSGDPAPSVGTSPEYRSDLVLCTFRGTAELAKTYDRFVDCFVLYYPLWDTCAPLSGYGTTWPRLGDSAWSEKHRVFDSQCLELAGRIGSARLPATTLTVQDAELYSSLDACGTIQLMLRHGLIALPGRSTTSGRSTAVRAEFVGHLTPPRSQIGSPWLVDAMDWGSQTTDESRWGYPMVQELATLAKNLTSLCDGIRLTNRVTLHVCTADSLRLPALVPVATEVFGLNNTATDNGVDPPRKRIRTQNKAATPQVLVLSALNNRHGPPGIPHQPGIPTGKQTLSAQPVELCDALNTLPEYVVIFTERAVSVHDVLRVLAAARRPSPHLHLYVVVPALRSRQYKMFTHQDDGRRTHWVLPPSQTAPTSGLTSGTYLDWRDHKFGV